MTGVTRKRETEKKGEREMKIVRYRIGGKKEYGIWQGENIQALAESPFPRIKKAERYHKMTDVRLLAPCKPSKIIALGSNYRSHCEETNLPVPTVPIMFFKPSTSVIGPEDNIIYPHGVKRFDYEAEVAVVISRRAFKVAMEKALNYVLGYTCLNDVSARDWQTNDNQWARPKGSDTYAPIGPCIETEADPNNLRVESYLNGVRKQQGNTSDLVFKIPELISYITETITLLPGDIIATGTPGGIGPMKVGDVIEIRMDAVGTLRNYVA